MVVRSFLARRVVFLLILAAAWAVPVAGSRADDAPPIYVALWFDTEDYLLPESDDAALKLANWLAEEKIRATFKVVGEKARTLERRGRTDVVEALKRHEIGYHSNWHSTQPTPAQYLSRLGWAEGVAEFDRRERPGCDDVQRIFGQKPSCYGQPGSSWGPQSYGAMKQWGMEVYLDAGKHVGLDGKPCYYCGILNLYHLATTLRCELGGPADLDAAEKRLFDAYQSLRKSGGGLISIFYHPCEFTHRKFWDGVNFGHGANPPRDQWKAPPAKTPEEQRLAYETFFGYIRFIHRLPDVRFITAGDAARLYRDKARGREFSLAELKAIAAEVKPDVSYQQHGDYALTAAEVLALLARYVALRAAGEGPESIKLEAAPLGPADTAIVQSEPAPTDRSQFLRTAADLDDILRKEGHAPPAVWLGSVGVPPEAYLVALARVAENLLDGKPAPEKIEIRPARLAVAGNVADDDPKIWGWVIFPDRFRAPALMELAKRQAWTLKPALVDRAGQ